MATLSKNEILQLLQSHDYSAISNARMNNDLGDRIQLNNGCIVNLYDTGKIAYQGKNTEAVKLILEGASTQPQNRKVFVVYGHDEVAKTQLEAMLRRWELEPIILDQLESQGNTIIEKLEGALSQARFGIVLATPDDMGYPKNKENEKKYRVRQNVVFEMGMLFARLGRSRVAILLKSTENMEKPSDIQGIMYMPFTNNVTEASVYLAKEMEKNGYHIDVSKL